MRDGRGGATAQECALAAAGCNREDILPIFQMLGRGKTWTQIYESRDSGRSQSIIALRAH